MTLLLLLAIILVGNLLLPALFLWLGARWVKAPKASFSRALLVALVISVLSALFLPVMIRVEEAVRPEGVLSFPVVACALVFGLILLWWLVIRSFFQTTFPRGIVIWAVSLIAGVAALAFLFGIIKPYVLEAFIVPTNAMAPAVVGWHQANVCPQCQGLLIVPSPPPEDREPEERQHVGFERDQLAICTLCRKTSKVQKDDSSIRTPDRILVNKLLTPQRWDMIVFRYPVNPSVKYVKRLVGLPGETVYIKEGVIWINEVRREPPAELAGLRYMTEVEGGLPVKLGTLENPWHLGQDQYCVLGDFSERASDSRFWGSVPGSHIEGVVSLCYWPFSRWKIHR